MNPQRDRGAGEPSAFLAGGGEMGDRTRSFDWSQTPLGPVAGWPQSLKTLVRTLLDSRYAMWLGWGPDFTFFYNDAYARMSLGPKHPWALGRSAREVWSEIWTDIGPRAESVVRTGRATWDEGLLLILERQGFPEETYHTFSYSPVPDDEGGVGGMLCVVTEDTQRTIGERRLRTLRELAAQTTDVAQSVEAACQVAARTLAGRPHDLPFVLLYLASDDGRRAGLVGRHGLDPDTPACPADVDLDLSPWPFREVARSGEAVVVDDLGERFGPLPGGVWPQPTRKAVVLPVAKPGQARPAGFVVAGVSPRLVFDDAYKGFLDLVAGHIATVIANARAYDEERRRAEALAELDRAKTAFFSNVSHEFRTPLTLMLGPVEELLARSETDLPPVVRDELEVVNRNGLRLLRLVNSLLDFSRIEAGRVRAVYQPTDLAAVTADLASVFRSACERAGLSLEVDCPPLGEPVFVDPEMWEKVVLNLLSNAFKFTFEGGIGVSLRRAGGAAELRVRDTGTGVPADEMHRLFERFHRVEGAQGRTHEGSGIGLALVQELVKLHGGAVTAESELGRGTTFTVSVPLGSAHLPADRIGGGRTAPSAGAVPFVEEALRWLPGEPPVAAPELSLSPEPVPVVGSRTTPAAEGERPRVLVADDNADMRQYVLRLLTDQYTVEAVADGEAALAAARERTPDLVLTDVMMPRLDGFGLLKELRADPRTRSVPVIMLSARAGEESRVEGMGAGADDYLVKPFGARELLARVGSLVQATRLRREAERRWRDLAEALPNLVWTALPDGRGDYFSRQCVAFTGVPEADLLGDAWLERVIHPDDRQRTLACWTAAVREQGVYDIVYRLRRHDGAYRWFQTRGVPVRDDRGGIVRWFGTCTDIEDQKQTQEALAQSEERYRFVVDTVPALVWSCRADGTTDFHNDRWFEYTGLPRDGGTGEDWRAVVHPDDVDRVVGAWTHSVRTGEPYRAEYRIRRASDGEYRWWLAEALPMRDRGGRVVRWFGTCTDIHDRRVAEHELRSADRRKDEFLATLAHELRNPLAPIRTGLQLLRLSGGDAVAGEKARTMMERQLGQMVRLVDDLMDVSRINQGKLELRKERTDLAAVLTSAVETSRPLIEQMGHHLEVFLPAQPVAVEADLTRLAQVFSNLLNNAAKYSERGGRITLAAERHGGDVAVAVRDTGIGIAADQLPRIFEMFSQVKSALERSQGGLGIGLCLVRRLLEMHGGRIEARSDGLGKGSEFVVQLPVVVETARPQPDAGDGGIAPKTSLRILVVDDNRDGADSLADMLGLMGGDTRTAYDGEAAVAAAVEFRPDVIVLDIGLPKLNGYEACRRIRAQANGRKVVVIAQTGWGQDEDRQRTQEAGFDYHLVKPVDPAALMKLLAGLSGAARA